MQTAGKIIHYDSPEAARPYTKEGWASANGLFYADEHTARWAGCTHVKCECGKWTEKMYTKCEDCRIRRRKERYEALPFQAWDTEQPICSFDGQHYFFDEEELIEHCEENEINPDDLLLVICEPNYMREVYWDHWEDVWPEDRNLPEVVEKALIELNKAIRAAGPVSYSPGKIRTSYKLPELK